MMYNLFKDIVQEEVVAMEQRKLCLKKERERILKKEKERRIFILK